MKTVTIGYTRDDGDFAVLATLNNNDGGMPDEQFSELVWMCRMSLSVRHEAGAVGQGIVDLEHQRFVAPHARKPGPTVRGVEFHGISLADATGIAALGDDVVIRRDRSRVAQGERMRLHGPGNRAPHLNDGEAA